MKIILFGANGQLGFELARALAALGEIVAATRDGQLVDGTTCVRADLAETASLANALAGANAQIIVNAAAYTAVDRAESEAQLADRINHRAIAEIGAWAAANGARVVHYSTDYVFDGSATRPYRENDLVTPLGVYGRSKLAGENALQDSGAAHLIFRASWVYAARGSNFLRTMLHLAGEREELRVVADQVGAPTPAAWIADATTAALAKWCDGDRAPTGLGGVYHIAAAGRCTWFEFAETIVRGALERELIARAPRVVPIATADYPTAARRPAFSVLDCSRLQREFGLQLDDWRTGLRAVLGAASA